MRNAKYFYNCQPSGVPCQDYTDWSIPSQVHLRCRGSALPEHSVKYTSITLLNYLFSDSYLIRDHSVTTAT